jgi:hypothetical protein
VVCCPVTVTHWTSVLLSVTVTHWTTSVLLFVTVTHWTTSVVLSVTVTHWTTSVLLSVRITHWTTSGLLSVTVTHWTTSVLLSVRITHWTTSVVLSVTVTHWTTSVVLSVTVTHWTIVYNGYRLTFTGVKQPGRGVDHPTPSSAKVKERVQLYLYSPSGPSWPVLGRTLPLPLPFLQSHTTPQYNQAISFDFFQALYLKEVSINV